LKARINRQEERNEFTHSHLLSRMDDQVCWILSLVVLAILVPIFLRLIAGLSERRV
jgi:hypothetical protein